jgi:hypothetical protein
MVICGRSTVSLRLRKLAFSNAWRSRSGAIIALDIGGKYGALSAYPLVLAHQYFYPMKISLCPRRRMPLVMAFAACALAMASGLLAQSTSPNWWAAQGAFAGLPTDNSAAVTVQQLYQVALAADHELDSKLAAIGGSSVSSALVTIWQNPPVAGLHAEYFNNLTLSGTPVLERQESADLKWGYHGNQGSLSPVDPTHFSVRWTGTVLPPADGNYLFDVSACGGSRLWVNGQLVLDQWNVAGWGGGRVVVPLTGGTSATVRLEYSCVSWWAEAHLFWAPPTTFRSEGVTLHGLYFNSPDFSGNPVVERDEVADFDWDTGAPDPALIPGQFSALWTGTFLQQPTPYDNSGQVTLGGAADGPLQIWLDDELVFDNSGAFFSYWSYPLTLAPGAHDLTISYQPGSGNDGYVHWAVMDSVWAGEWGPDGPLSFSNNSYGHGSEMGRNGYAVSLPAGTGRFGTGLDGDGRLVLHGQYDFGGTVLERDEVVDYNWGDGSPDPAVPVQSFSASWTGLLDGSFAGKVLVVQRDGVLSVDELQALQFYPTSDHSGPGHTVYPISIDYTHEAGTPGSIHAAVCDPSQVGALVASWAQESAMGYPGPQLLTLANTHYAPNLGMAATRAQARAIAALFRTRLTALGYQGYPADLASDTGPLTVGDLKALFNFDLDQVVNLNHQTFAQAVSAGLNPNDWYLGAEHHLVVVYGDNQVGPPGHFLPKPMTVRIVGAHGRIFANAPVTFSLPASDPDFISAKADGSTPLLKTLTVHTDKRGYAWVYNYLSPSP